MASDPNNVSSSSSTSLTIFLISIIIWFSCDVRTLGVRRFLLDVGPQALSFAVIFLGVFCILFFEQCIPLYSDEPPKWRVLTSLDSSIWTMAYSGTALALCAMVFRQRVLHGLEFWLPTLVMGYVGFIVKLYCIDGFGWDEFRYCLQLPKATIVNGILLAKKTPELIRLVWMHSKYSAYRMDS